MAQTINRSSELLPSIYHLLFDDDQLGYTLNRPLSTSAGVYDKNGVLLRTLWSNVRKPAGYHPGPSWDGLDDSGQSAAEQGDHILVIANDVQARWEGVIGNLSDSFTESKHKELNFYHEMLIHDGAAYFASEYAERDGAVAKSDLRSMGTKETVSPEPFIQQSVERMATDGTRLYMAGRNPQDLNQSYVQAAKFDELGDWNDYLIFQGDTLKIYAQTYKVADIVDSYERFPPPPNVDNLSDSEYRDLLYRHELSMPRVTGLAVQRSGNFLFVARERLDSLHVLHKITGERFQTLSLKNVKHAKVDNNDDLWLVYDVEGDETLAKFSVNDSTGAITPTGLTIRDFYNVQALAFHPTQELLAVADAAESAHQVKSYNTVSGEKQWTLGREESYVTAAKVYNDKFSFGFNTDSDPYFSHDYARGYKDEYSFLAYEADGSLWVNDRGNSRYLKFDSNLDYKDQMMWQRARYSLNVDPNNTKRVFYDYLEFEVSDYSKSLRPDNANNAWRLVNNWAASTPLGRQSWNSALETVTTLSNGRTYALIPGPELPRGQTRTRAWSIVELVADGAVRNTGVTIAGPNDGNAFYNPTRVQLKADGVFRWVDDAGVQAFYEQRIIGFDPSHNPILGPQRVWDSYSLSREKFSQSGPWRVSGEFTENGNLVLFDGGHANDSGFHLAAWNKELDRFMFKTARGTVYQNGSPYPKDGTYDLRSGVENRGSVALAMDDWIIWGYYGEFYENRQTNKWHMVSEEGLFLREFGVAVPSTDDLDPHTAGMAGNAFAPALVKHNDDIAYLWHNDESYHAGAHRWQITNLSSIQKFKLRIRAQQ